MEQLEVLVLSVLTEDRRLEKSEKGETILF